jgi:hypothetical protein
MFGKRVTGDLRVVATCAEQAIDWSQTPRLQYVETRDFDLLKFKAGEEACVFTLRSLPMPLVARARTQDHPQDKLFAFVWAVRECSHAQQLGLRWIGSGEDRQVAPDSLEALPAKVWQEIGSVVLQRADLSEGESPRFALSRG